MDEKVSKKLVMKIDCIEAVYFGQHLAQMHWGVSKYDQRIFDIRQYTLKVFTLPYDNIVL